MIGHRFPVGLTGGGPPVTQKLRFEFPAMTFLLFRLAALRATRAWPDFEIAHLRKPGAGRGLCFRGRHHARSARAFLEAEQLPLPTESLAEAAAVLSK